MAARKTTGEMIAEIEKKQEQMNARKKQLCAKEAAVETGGCRKPESQDKKADHDRRGSGKDSWQTD